MRRLSLLLVLAVVAVVGPAPPAAAGPPDPLAVTYVAPVAGPVVDHFRPPATRYGPGNRGIDYATTPGSPVRAAAPGEVVFAGPVAGSLHVVVLHPDGIRTSYSFLAAVGVRRGQRVVQGDPVGTAGPSLHFGARVGDRYIDPTLLLDGGAVDVFLVSSGTPPAPASERAEGLALLDVVLLAPVLAGPARVVAADWEAFSAGGAARRGAEWAADELGRAALAHAQGELRRMAVAAHLGAEAWQSGRLPADLNDAAARAAAAVAEWQAQRDGCTPPATEPARVAGRRIVVLVGGLGSSSEAAGVWALDDPARLGYDDARVVRFSYRGGTADERPYGPADTEGDLWVAARRLRRLLADLHAADPAAVIDVVAHSQGGLVTRAALSFDLGVGPLLPGVVGTVVTLASPHQGAPLAALAVEAGDGRVGRRLVEEVAERVPAVPPPDAPALAQLSVGSSFLRALPDASVPATVRFVSIAGRQDLVVPPERARLPGAPLVVVDTAEAGWVDSHNRLPALDATVREVRLAVAGLGPTCRSLAAFLLDAAVGAFTHRLDHAGSAAAALLGSPYDRAPPGRGSRPW